MGRFDYNCVRDIDFVSFYDFSIVILKMFQKCGIFCG